MKKLTVSDLMGRRHGMLVIEEVINNEMKSDKTLVKCRCDCGQTKTMILTNFRISKACGCRLKGGPRIPAAELLGARHGMLEVIEILDEGSGDSLMLRCQCDCGNVKTMKRQNFRAANSCGCLHKAAGERRAIDITGERCGRLLALRSLGSNEDNNNMLWVCQCDCGKEVTISCAVFRYGEHVSCGCYGREQSGKRLGALSRSRVGAKNHRYDPTLTEEQRSKGRRRFNRHMIRCRDKVYKRDAYTCQACGATKSNSFVHHHIKSWKFFPKHRFWARNCTTLCVQCHKKFHKSHGYGAGNWKQFVPWIRARRKETGFVKS